ncbi:hypothetical protein ACRRTK_014804 [Alexandromys fortis]
MTRADVDDKNSTIIWGGDGDFFFFQKQAFEHHSPNANKKQFTRRNAIGYKFEENGRSGQMWLHMTGQLLHPLTKDGGEERRES